MTTPRLAICIPTYNRGPFLRETIENIRKQSADVEIVVSDNASTDETEGFMRELASHDPRIVYVRQPENRGPDVNYLEAVRHARAEFCWLMGSDDYPAPEGIRTVEQALGDDVDVILTDRVRRSRDMREDLGTDRFLNAAPGAYFDCSRAGELERYLRCAHFIGSLFSFLSAIIVRRTVWDRQPRRDDLVGSAYIHAARIFDMLQDGARLRYLGEPVVWCRLGNDSFEQSLGTVDRLLLDFNYVRIAQAVFGDREEARELIIALIERNHFRTVLDWKIVAARLGGRAAVERVRAAARVFTGRPGYRRRMLAFRLPPVALQFLLPLCRRLSANTRAALGTFRRRRGAADALGGTGTSR